MWLVNIKQGEDTNQAKCKMCEYNQKQGMTRQNANQEQPDSDFDLPVEESFKDSLAKKRNFTSYIKG